LNNRGERALEASARGLLKGETGEQKLKPLGSCRQPEIARNDWPASWENQRKVEGTSLLKVQASRIILVLYDHAVGAAV
jgi:hypothetical protein